MRAQRLWLTCSQAAAAAALHHPQRGWQELRGGSWGRKGEGRSGEPEIVERRRARGVKGEARSAVVTGKLSRRGRQ